MIVAGTVTLKMASRIERLYAQMPEPKFVISMGCCATSGGPYWDHGYHVLKGVDKVVPVDVFLSVWSNSNTAAPKLTFDTAL